MERLQILILQMSELDENALKIVKIGQDVGSWEGGGKY